MACEASIRVSIHDFTNVFSHLHDFTKEKIRFHASHKIDHISHFHKFTIKTIFHDFMNIFLLFYDAQIFLVVNRLTHKSISLFWKKYKGLLKIFQLENLKRN